MRMVMVIYRHSLDQDLRRLLKSLDIKAFTESPKLLGVGETTHACGASTWPGHNAIILSAMEDDQAERVIGMLRKFRDHMVELQGGAKIPLRVFTLPCERVI
ncbi:MAG: PG0541 family transporter-associated protein [Nitrospiraceae bacterium]